ncbi:acetolactate synthase large subunit [Gammaproteobacteria bacterium 45_16_T64]|nr:acetolactate synthase large subunit [Gammaproteobacteria bacterium 45_16_T64]
MKKTGAWLVKYALEQIGVRHTFGVPGVHNTEIYDELNNSDLIQPILVVHESSGSFIADAISRTSDTIGTMMIVPAAGAAYASAGMGEAYMAGVPMLVIAGGIRGDGDYRYQLHDMDQHALLAPITKKTYLVEDHQDIIPSIYAAYELANAGLPGPVFVEVPVNVQLDKGDVVELPVYRPILEPIDVDQSLVDVAVEQLCAANLPGIFVGWGARDATELLIKIADLLHAPVSTTLQGLSVFPAEHPLHTGMGFGPAAVPAATNAFKHCDCMLAVGTRFAEIPTGSFGVTVPEKLIHIDIDANVLNANYPASVSIEGDAVKVLEKIVEGLIKRTDLANERIGISTQIKRDKFQYDEEWAEHDSGDKVNPSSFFKGLRVQIADDDYVVADDGNHTFLTAELMPIHKSKHFISPSDFNCMGYCVPAVIGVKLLNPDKRVIGIVGDGAFSMSCMEILTASRLRVGGVFFVFNDGELSQISQAQEIPYNRKTCTVLGNLDISGVAQATGAEFITLNTNSDIMSVIKKAITIADTGKPVVVDVNVDYSKRTRFTKGIVGTNLKRFDMGTKARFIGRAVKRKFTG